MAGKWCLVVDCFTPPFDELNSPPTHQNVPLRIFHLTRLRRYGSL